MNSFRNAFLTDRQTNRRTDRRMNGHDLRNIRAGLPSQMTEFAAIVTIGVGHSAAGGATTLAARRSSALYAFVLARTDGGD